MVLTDLPRSLTAPPTVAHDNVCDLKLTAKLNSFNILVCDQKTETADIRIQGKSIGSELNPTAPLSEGAFSPEEDVCLLERRKAPL